jgi:site-specific DNA-cytosine methylase
MNTENNNDSTVAKRVLPAVLSLFDGMSCGQIALNKIGYKYSEYYASEIDKYAMQVTQKNYPKTKQIGSVTDVNANNLPKIELLYGGSPCQGFSIAGKKLNFEDDRSKLFMEFVRLKNELKPKYFLLENVRMKDDIADAIDELLGVKRIFIDSRDFTGHIRKRFYWTNIPVGKLPKINLKIKDIIDENPFDKDMSFFLDRTPYSPTKSYDGIITINPKDNNNKQTWQRGRVYDIEGNCPTICASLFDLNITKDHKTYRKLSINECEKLQGVPKDYTDGVSKGERGKMLGNGWTVDVIAHILSFIPQS